MDGCWERVGVVDIIRGALWSFLSAYQSEGARDRSMFLYELQPEIAVRYHNKTLISKRTSGTATVKGRGILSLALDMLQANYIVN